MNDVTQFCTIFEPPPPSTRFLLLRPQNSSHKIIDPLLFDRDVIYGRPLIRKLPPKLFLTPFHLHFTSSFFCMKVLCAAFFYLQFVLVFFGKRKLAKKAAPKMLGKLTLACCLL